MTELQKTTGSAMAPRPSFIPQSDAGREHITKTDIRLPRLALAQAMSPQVKRGEGAYIEGLQQGDLFNDLTAEKYGTEPIEFFIVRADRPRWVEFNPRDSGGGVKDLDVPEGDPRTQFTQNEQGKSVPPAATQFYDFVIVLVPSMTPIILSFKSTGLKDARSLNGLIQLRQAPLFAGKYSVKPVTRKNAKGEFYAYGISNAGWANEEEYAALAKLFDDFKDKTITYNHETDNPGDEQPAPLNQSGVEGENIPF